MILRHKINISLFCIFSLIGSIAAQQYIIDGTVYDANNKTTMPNASIFVLETGKGVISDQNGKFSLTLTKGKYQLVYSYLGYTPDTFLINLSGNITQNCYLAEKVNTVQEVKVSAQNTIKSTETGVTSLSAKEMEKLPYLMGEYDPVKAMQLTPGVQSGKDGGSGYFIRGGNADQNLILFDGATIYNPSHLFGFFSVFNGDIIQNVKLIKSGIPADYGGKLAAVLDINTTDGQTHKVTGKGNIGLLSSKVFVQGPLNNKVNFLASYRRTYIDLLLKGFDKYYSENSGFHTLSAYYFYDVNAKLSARISEKDKLSLSFYLGNDDLNYKKSISNFYSQMNWGNMAFSFNWAHYFNNNFFVSTSTAYTRYNYSLLIGQSDYSFQTKSQVNDFNFKHKYTFIANKHKLTFGLENNYRQFDPNLQNIKVSESNIKVSDIKDLFSNEISLFFTDNWSLNNKLHAAIGGRITNYTHLGPYTTQTKNELGEITSSKSYKNNETVKHYLRAEPRIALRYLATPNASVKISYTHNYQYIHIANISTVALPTDLWLPSTDFIKPQFGNQLALGYYYQSKNKAFSLNVEAFYKTMKNQIEFKQGIVDAYQLSLNERLTFGNGNSKGAEIWLQKKQGKITGWLAYTLSYTKRKFTEINNGDEYFAKHDRRHDISLVSNYEINTNWKLSGVFTLASGNRLTIPSSRYLVQERPLNEYKTIYSFTMPAYHRMDISCTYHWLTRRKNNSELVFSVYNIYNRANPYFIYFENEIDTKAFFFSNTPKMVSLFPVLPSVSWSFTF